MNPEDFNPDYEGTIQDAEAFISLILGEDGWDNDPEWDREGDL